MEFGQMNFSKYWGSAAKSALELNSLRYLDLSGNSFTRIPQFIGSLKELQYLNLANIEFTVPGVPYQLGNLSNLISLDFSGSSITLKNTEWLSHLSSLKFLNLSYTDLSESINLLDNVINRLPSLVELHVGTCLLPNSTAKSFLPVTNFSKSLAILDLSLNYLSASTIYPWLFNFSSSISDLDLSYNELLGTIPEEFGTFDSLQNLDLTVNGLEGGIPSSFGNLSNLRSLYLSGNNLNEDLPTFFHKLSGSAKRSIHVLELDDNQLRGSLPDFTTFTALQELNLHMNQLNGTFPEKFEQTSNLFILD